jgi:hypothetical protein
MYFQLSRSLGWKLYMYSFETLKLLLILFYKKSTMHLRDTVTVRSGDARFHRSFWKTDIIKLRGVEIIPPSIDYTFDDRTELKLPSWDSIAATAGVIQRSGLAQDCLFHWGRLGKI